MNRKGHVVLGIIGFVIYTVLLQNVRFFEVSILIIGGLASTIGSMIPDLIEPAGDFRHRGFAHSRRVLKMLFMIFLATSLICLLIPVMLILPAGLLGYILHLLADSTTKTGIPE
ncbi:MAG: metal-dependent hydrolase [Nitrososphaerota archaeon]|nr:metal-dependent hydrolase [Nitrososphaerota archaeon]